MPDPVREILRLQALLRQRDEELERKEMEWRMRDLPPRVGDLTGSTSRDNATFQDHPMDTSDVNREADDLLSQSDAGSSGGGGGDGLHQQEMPPPPVV